MHSMKSLMTRLRRLRLRPPSRRVRARLFGVPAGRAPGRGTVSATLLLAATAVYNLGLAFWIGPARGVREAGWGEAMRPEAAGWAAGWPPARPTLRNAVPARLEWTNPGPALSSMPSLPLGWTNRMR